MKAEAESQSKVEEESEAKPESVSWGQPSYIRGWDDYHWNNCYLGMEAEAVAEGALKSTASASLATI